MFDFETYHILFAAVGIAIIASYWLPRFLSGREPAASALLVAGGAAISGLMPEIPPIISPVNSPLVWEHMAEACVIIGLFGTGLRIDRLLGWSQWKPTLRLLTIAMPLTIIALAVLGWAAAGMTLAGGLLLGAVLAPTDPVLAGDVQVGAPHEGGEHPTRFALTTEAGLNDGLAFPFVHLGMALVLAGGFSTGLMFEWLWKDVVYRIAVGGAAGLAVGWLVGKVLFDWPRENSLSKTQSGVIAFAGVLVAYGATELVEGYGFLAAFIAGIALRRAESNDHFHKRLHDFTESLEHALTALLLLALGAALPSLFEYLGWTQVMIAALLLLVIRPITAWIALIGTPLTGKSRLVTSFFGVRGIGSVYYLAYAGHYLELANEETLWAIVAFTIVLSTVIHGLTASIALEKVTDDDDAEPDGGNPANAKPAQA